MVSAAVGLPNAAASNTRCVPRLGRNLIEESTSPAHTPLALITARADTSNDSPVQLVGQPHRGPPVASDAATRVRIARAVLGGGAGDGGDQAGVVDQLPVIGEQPAAEAVAADRGDQLDGPRRARSAETGAASTTGVPASRAQPVAREEAGAHQRPLGAAHRRQQAEPAAAWRVTEVRRVARHQDSAFDGAAPGDADVAGRQVAQAAVHELGAPPTGAERQVVLFDQRDRAARGTRRPARSRCR